MAKNKRNGLPRPKLMPLAKYWSKLIGLEGWSIHVRYVEAKEIDGCYGQCYIQSEHRSLSISIADPRGLPKNVTHAYDAERTVVHELMHVWFDLLLGGRQTEHPYKNIVEQAINTISASMVKLKRQGEEVIKDVEARAGDRKEPSPEAGKAPKGGGGHAEIGNDKDCIFTVAEEGGCVIKFGRAADGRLTIRSIKRDPDRHTGGRRDDAGNPGGIIDDLRRETARDLLRLGQTDDERRRRLLSPDVMRAVRDFHRVYLRPATKEPPPLVATSEEVRDVSESGPVEADHDVARWEGEGGYCG